MDVMTTALRMGVTEVEPVLSDTGGGESKLPTYADRLRLEHEPGPRGGAWTLRTENGEDVYSVGRRPYGGSRVVVRDAQGSDQASIGERVLSLVENHTIWRGGRPYARVYRPTRRSNGDRWFVEIGEQEGWVVLADSAGLRVLSAGEEVAKLACRDDRGVPRCVEVAPGVDVALVLSLASLLHTIEDVSV